MLKKKHFKNVQNKSYKVNGKEIWHSRSVALVYTYMIQIGDSKFVLLCKRGQSLNDAFKWCLPCGYLDWNETLIQGAQREVWEETGLDIFVTQSGRKKLIKSFHGTPWRIQDSPDTDRQNISIHFGKLESADRLPFVTNRNSEWDGTNYEILKVKWVNVNDLKNYSLAFNHDSVIRSFMIKTS